MDLDRYQKENIATMAITAIALIGLYLAGAGGWSFWALLILTNMNRNAECACDDEDDEDQEVKRP